MIEMSVFDNSMINRLSTLSKMSLREEAVKYFSRTSQSSGQSRSICFTVYLLDHADKCRCCNKTERKKSTMTAFVTRSKPLVTKANRDKLHQNESLFVERCQLAFYVVVTAYFRRYFYPGRFWSPGQVLPGRDKSWVS